MGKLCFFQNRDFQLRRESGKFYFVHSKSKDRVITDELGRAIWESLPGLEEEVTRMSADKSGAEDWLVRNFLRVMLRAEIVNRLAEDDREGENFVIREEQISPNEKTEDACIEAPTLISVVIVTFNSEEHIRGCLESVLGQTYKNLEVIVVDNASKDRTIRIVQTHFPLVRIFPLRKNLYFPAGVNYGLKMARGNFYLILNDDLELDRHCLSRLMTKITSDGRAGAVVPMIKFHHLRGFINGIGNQIRERGWGSDNFIGCVDVGQFSELTEVPSACFGAVLVRRQTIEDVGLLDPKYQSYYEDSDWSFRCWMRGWKIVPEVRAVVFHKFGAHWKTSELKLKLVARNRLRLILKLFQGRTLLRFLRNYVTEDARNCLSLLGQRKFGSAAAFPKAYVSLVFSLPGIYLQRRKFFRKKRPLLEAVDILKKNPEPFSCLNNENVPRLDCDIISKYYSRYLKEREITNQL